MCVDCQIFHEFYVINSCALVNNYIYSTFNSLCKYTCNIGYRNSGYGQIRQVNTKTPYLL